MQPQEPFQPAPPPVQPQSPQSTNTSEQPKQVPDQKMIDALLATTKAEMEQESTRKEELRSSQRTSYLSRFLEMFNPEYVAESPRVRRRLIIFLIVTVGSTILSIAIGGMF